MSGESSDFDHIDLNLEKNLAGTFSVLSPRALIIDDNPANIRLLSQQLNFLGCQVDSANSGDAGLDLWQLHKHLIVIVDCHMPGMDGKEVISQIVNSVPYEHGIQHIIAYSADTSEIIRHEYIASGADYFASKPLALLNLHNLLVRCIEKSAGMANTESRLVATNPVSSTIAQLVESGLGSGALVEQGIVGVKTVGLKIVNVDYIYKILGDDPCRQATHRYLAAMFSKQAPTVLSDMIAANEQHDTVQLGHLVHKFKSSARSVGADRVAAVCVSLEDLIPQDNFTEIGKILRGFDDYLQEVEKYWVTKTA